MRPIMLFLAATTLSTPHAPARGEPVQAAAPDEARLAHVAIRQVGEGPPIVLIPGLASPPEVWDDLVTRLARDHRLILVHLNGFAGEPAGANGQGPVLSGSVDEIAGWLAAQGIEKPEVIGHSMGGLMAMMLARRHPAAAGKLMIVDALPFYGMLMGPGATPDSVRPIAEQMRAAVVNGPQPTQAPPHMSNSESGRARIVEWLRASDPKVVGQALVEDATVDFRPHLPEIADHQVTVLYAVPNAGRKPLTEGLYREAYKALPEAELVGIENSEHFIMLDQPEQFAREVERFLD